MECTQIHGLEALRRSTAIGSEWVSHVRMSSWQLE